MSGDAMVQQFNLDREYQVKVPDKKDWKKGPPVREDSNWYADSPKTE